MAVFSIGAMIRSGASRETAAIIASLVAATQTRISWPRSTSSIQRRWLRLLWALVKKRIRISFLVVSARLTQNGSSSPAGEAEGVAKVETGDAE
jgi:hypothetical protein